MWSTLYILAGCVNLSLFIVFTPLVKKVHIYDHQHMHGTPAIAAACYHYLTRAGIISRARGIPLPPPPCASAGTSVPY